MFEASMSLIQFSAFALVVVLGLAIQWMFITQFFQSGKFIFAPLMMIMFGFFTYALLIYISDFNLIGAVNPDSGSWS